MSTKAMQKISVVTSWLVLTSTLEHTVNVDRYCTSERKLIHVDTRLLERWSFRLTSINMGKRVIPGGFSLRPLL